MELTTTLLFASDAAAAASDRLGGKAKGLAVLWGLGCAVPEFCVVPAEAHRAHLVRGEIPAAIGRAELALAEVDLDADDAAGAIGLIAADLRAAVEAVPIAGDVREAITDALRTLGDGPYAVRSSMVGEDSVRHSFAGQLDSELFLPDADAVADAVVRCWGSAYGNRALAYATRAGLVPSSVRMGVVIQRMIDADVAGVLFTANPLTGDRDESLLTAAWGQGEGIVSGVCDTDEYTWRATAGETGARLADKDVAVRANPDGPGTVEVPVDAELRSVRCLTRGQVEEICRIGLKVAQAAKRPMDLEYAFWEGRLYILQARPITSLPPRRDPAVTTPTVWDNANIQESYCGVTTPLTFSFASGAYRSVYRQFSATFGVRPARLAELEPTVRNMLGLVDGRVYYNLNSWYRLLAEFPAFAKNKEDMERMMGVEEPVDFVEDPPADLGAAIARYRQLVEVAVRLLPRMRRLDAEVDRFCAHFDAVVATVDRSSLRDKSLTELQTTLEALYGELLDKWETPIVNDMRVMMTSGKLRRILEKVHGPDEAEAQYAELIGGIDGLASVAPTRMLMGIARTIRATDGARATLETGTPVEAWCALHDRYPGIGAELDGYVTNYGDRVMGELKLETITARDDPSFVIDVLRNFVLRNDLDPDALSAREQERFTAARWNTENRLPWRARPKFLAAVDDARTAVAARERLRLLRTIAFGLVRDVFCGMGMRLAEAGVLEDAADVMYLTTDELEAYIDGRAVTLDLDALVRTRKLEFAAYESTEVPNRFETFGPPSLDTAWRNAASAPIDTDAEVLTGLGCCAGTVDSAVKIILSPDDELSVNNKILVTIRTDPGWAPLFPTCSGLIVERGSALSHSAVVAREMGIPAVVGVRDATKILANGERVRLDGGAGRIERLDAGVRAEAAATSPEVSA